MKPLLFKTTPALQDFEENITMSMKEKKALVYKSVFLKPPHSIGPESRIRAGIAHIDIIEEKISYTLTLQSTRKAPDPHKINFQIFRIIWNWDKNRLTSIIQQAVQLGYYPKSWKRVQRILLEKVGKCDFGLVRSYRVISLLNYMGKILEKVIAKQLSQFSKAYSKLHSS